MKKNICVVVCIIAVVLIGMGLWIYLGIDNNNQENNIESGTIYFESDLLVNSKTSNNYTYQRKNDYIEIKLKNYIDDITYSDVNVNYTVKITDLDGNDIENAQGKKVKEFKGKLEKEKASIEIVRFENLKRGGYTVTASVDGNNDKTIKANFVLTGEK